MNIFYVTSYPYIIPILPSFIFGEMIVLGFHTFTLQDLYVMNFLLHKTPLKDGCWFKKPEDKLYPTVLDFFSKSLRSELSIQCRFLLELCSVSVLSMWFRPWQHSIWGFSWKFIASLSLQGRRNCLHIWAISYSRFWYFNRIFLNFVTTDVSPWNWYQWYNEAFFFLFLVYNINTKFGLRTWFSWSVWTGEVARQL